MFEQPFVREMLAGLPTWTMELSAGHLLTDSTFISPHETNAAVATLLERRSDLALVAVVEAGRPIGLISRGLFMEGMSKPYSHERFAKENCMAFMDKAPLVVDCDMDIRTLSVKALDATQKVLQTGFIITDPQGFYLGQGAGESLVGAIVHLQAEKNRLLAAGINYASVIQKAFLHLSKKSLQAASQEHFVFWMPREQVGGDYYFCRNFADGFFLALMDCTGHGVPGAFMTLIIGAFLDQILTADNCHDPAAVLGLVNKKIKTVLWQNYTRHFGGQSNDGMDAMFCWFDLLHNELVYAGVHTLGFVLEGASPAVYLSLPDSKGVGYASTPMDYQWRNQSLALVESQCVYLSTDGLLDQIGGDRRIAFGKKRFLALLEQVRRQPLLEQKLAIKRAFADYQGQQRRRDDVCLLGLRILTN